MPKFKITGNKPLEGRIKVAGSKNAVLALMAATLLTDEECVLTNVPRIKDVEFLAEILKDLGSEFKFSDNELTIRTAAISKSDPNPELVGKFRASILLIGALLGRIKQCRLPRPGGDNIGARPIDTHLSVFRGLGVDVIDNQELQLNAKKLVGGKIVLEESSVTATENALLASVLAKGTTTIKLAAMEPHVQQLANFLNKMGAKISGIGSPTLIVEGVDKLSGAQIEVIADSEEATSFITLAAATKSKVRVSGFNPDYIEDYLLKLSKMRVNMQVGLDFVQVLNPKQPYLATKLQCGLWPKLNSDFLPPMAVLATQAEGITYIYEWLYENRLGYVPELVKMGARAEILDPHRVKITGPTSLHGEKITTFDLRMGVTLVIAALVAEGESEISDIHHIDRGYERLEERLAELGAEIKRVN